MSPISERSYLIEPFFAIGESVTILGDDRRRGGTVVGLRVTVGADEAISILYEVAWFVMGMRETCHFSGLELRLAESQKVGGE